MSRRKLIIAEDKDRDIRWERQGRTHTVTYGKQVSEFRGYDADVAAAEDYGLCIRHAAECEGMFND